MNPSETTLFRWLYPFMNTQYPTFPNLWMPETMGSLFVVKVSPELDMLDEATYLALMQTRLDWMIQDWLTVTSQSATQASLATTLSQLDSAQEIPILEPDDDLEFALNQWRQQWSETLILNNWRFRERMRHYGLTFPTRAIAPSHSNYPDWLTLHDETSLEEWLTDLTP